MSDPKVVDLNSPEWQRRREEHVAQQRMAETVRGMKAMPATPESETDPQNPNRKD